MLREINANYSTEEAHEIWPTSVHFCTVKFYLHLLTFNRSLKQHLPSKMAGSNGCHAIRT
jgi:hypothetical protein